jgi:hypothetical protein
VISRTHTRPAAVTAIDADEGHVAFGTASGQVIIAGLDFVNGRCFTVSDSPIVYVALSLAADRVFFQSTKHVGEIAVWKRSVLTYASRARLSAVRCTLTPARGLVVKREPNYLWVVVGGR